LKSIAIPPFSELDNVLTNGLNFFARFIAMYINTLKLCQVKLNEERENSKGDRFYLHDLMERRKDQEKRRNRIKKYSRKVDKRNQKKPFDRVDDDSSRYGNEFYSKVERKFEKKRKKKFKDAWGNAPKMCEYSTSIDDFNEKDLIEQKNLRMKLGNDLWCKYGKRLK
jgi:hypothetical protein